MLSNRFMFASMFMALVLVLVSCTSDNYNSSSQLYVNSEFNYSFEVPSTFLSIDPGFNDVVFNADEHNETLLTAFSGTLNEGTTFDGTYETLKRELPYKLGAKIVSEGDITVKDNEARRLELSYRTAGKEFRYILILIKTPNNRFLGISFIGLEENYSRVNNILDHLLNTLNFNLLVVGKRI